LVIDGWKEGWNDEVLGIIGSSIAVLSENILSCLNGECNTKNKKCDVFRGLKQLVMAFYA
jgi:hypothetical protein